LAWDSWSRVSRRAGSRLVGLEQLVASDIIRSVVIAPSFATVGVLAILVVIRTFLSWSLEVEASGRWPWQEVPATEC
jgi:uncharacterized membrane protein